MRITWTTAIFMTLIFSGCTVFSPVTTGHDRKERPADIERTADEPRPERQRPAVAVQPTVRQKRSEDISYRITDIDFTGKNNGVLITIHFTGDNPERNIHTFFSGDSFFNISFFKGSFSGTVKSKTHSRSVIRDIKYFEFPDSSQITVRLRKDYDSSHVETDGNMIRVSVF